MGRKGLLVIPVLVIGLLAGAAIGAAIAHGHDDGQVVQVTAPGSTQAGEPVRVVTVERDGRWHGYGFFPFGILLFPLLWIGLVCLVFGGRWRHRGPGWGRWDERFEEWHRRQHENGQQGSGSGPGEANGS